MTEKSHKKTTDQPHVDVGGQLELHSRAGGVGAARQNEPLQTI